MLRRELIAVVAVLLTFGAGDTRAQYEPIGDHYAPMGNASGFGSGAVSPTGGYQTAVPLDLPAPRGDLSLPLAVVYDGGNQVGEAGLGWSVPFAYVMRSASLSRRKPAFTFSDAPPKPLERIFLSMGGGSMLMNPTGASHRYRPMVADAYLELRFQPTTNKWLAHDASGREYVFAQVEGLGDVSLWFLTEVTDRTRKNKIVLTYEVLSATAPGGAVFKELSLTEVAYSYGPDGDCPKHRIKLEYCVPGETECAPGDGSILRYIVDHGQVRVRRRVLWKIVVWSHADESCSEEPDKALRTYGFFYEHDRGTKLPRLSRVDLQGIVSTPTVVGAPGPTLPVTRYKYGSALLSLGPSPDFLLYVAPSNVQLPWDVAATRGSFGSMVEGFNEYSTRHLFADFTGDGLPDYANVGTPLGLGDNLLLARNITDMSGTRLETSTRPLFPDPGVRLMNLSHQRTLEARYSQHHQSNITDKAVQVIDWNGDGRLDVVDAPGGEDTLGHPSPNYWRVLLNIPSPTTTNPEAFSWHERQVDVKHIRDRMESREPELLLPGEYTPLSRSQTSGRKETRGCRDYQFHEATGKWYLTECRHPSPELEGICVEPCTRMTPGSTITEWKLLDANGDGFPDLVFNEQGLMKSQTDTNDKSSCFYPFPEEASSIPSGFRRECSDFSELELPEENKILAFYNINGGGLANVPARVEFSAQPEVLVRDSRCGVERWREISAYAPGHQTMSCGFTEVNGDGLIDYVTASRVDGSWVTLLNTGVPSPHDPPVNFHEGLAIKLPGPPGQVDNGHFPTCKPETISLASTSPTPTPTPVPGDTKYYVTHRRALTDLTGDGIPDYVFFDDNQSSPSYRKWMVSVGTGSGFAQPVEIISGGRPFELSRVEELCRGGVSKTVAGLVDIDGDGRADLVHAAEGAPGTPTLLKVGKLVGGSATVGAHDAGRLISVSNGYGGKTLIKYGSAKTDARTAHHVPFAEVVVTETVTLAEKGLGSSLEPVRYAYGDAKLRYHPLLARWIFTGYGRHVVLRGLKASRTTDNSADPARDLAGTAQIYDAVRLEEGNAGFSSYVLVGRIRDVYYLDGLFKQDPGELLDLDVSRDPRWHSNAHTDYGVKLVSSLPDPSPASNECSEVDPYPPYSVPPVPDQQLCRRTGVVFTLQTTSWNGTEAPPSAKSVGMRTSVQSVDGYGRPLLINYANDTARDDDDVCLRLQYASGGPSGVKILDAVHTARLSRCVGPQGVALAGARYRYDNLPEGRVRAGLLSHHIVERRNPRTGGLLGGPLELGVTTHDDFGNVTSVTLTKESGDKDQPLTKLTRTIHYDSFRIVPKLIVDSSGGKELVAAVEYAPVSLLPEAVIDGNNVQLRTYYDGFGRPEWHTVVTYPEKQEYALSKTEYLGDDPGDPDGRRVRRWSFHSWVIKGSVSDPVLRSTDVTDSTAYVDELDRVRFTEQALGADYGDKSLVVGYVEYDGLGRKSFAASPFLWSSPRDSRYGTSFLPDGRIQCLIDGAGRQPLTREPDERLDRYPTCFDYSFINNQAATHVKGPGELLQGSPQAGAYDEVRTTAMGQAVSVSRWKNGFRLEAAEYEYDRLGRLEQVSRSPKPSAIGAPWVSWSFLYDSLGHLLRIQEQGAATRKYAYDRWGNLLKVSWLDTSSTPAVARNTVNVYDGFGRLERSEFAAGEEVDQKSVVRYYYDSPSGDPNHLSSTNLRGRLSYATDDTVKTFFGYDSLGRATSTSRVRTREPERGRLVQERKFTPVGQLGWLGFRLPDTGGELEKVEYRYDSARRVRGMTWTDRLGTSSLFESLEVDILGRHLNVRLGNGVSETYSYRPDRRRELQSQTITNRIETRTVSYAEHKGANRFGYNGANRLKGRRESVTRGHLDPSPMIEETTYTYDAMNRLERAQTTGFTFTPPRVVGDESFIYDALGNIRQINDHVTLNTLELTQDVRDPDRLCRSERIPFVPEGTGSSSIPISEPGGCTYTYDTLGNVSKIQDTSDSARTFSYDPASRLISMQRNEASALIRYDAFGNVSEVSLSDPTTGVKRQDRRYGPLVEESDFFDADGRTVIERRVPGPAGIVTTRRGSGDEVVVLYQHGDFNANRLFTDKEGKIVQRVGYRPYGDIDEEGGGADETTYTKYLWNGGETFKQFNVSHLGARAYDPVAGRFLQRDPLFIPRNASHMNPYAFAFGDPINFRDPSGLDAGRCDEYAPGCGGAWTPDWLFDFADLGLSIRSIRPSFKQPTFIKPVIEPEDSPVLYDRLLGSVPSDEKGGAFFRDWWWEDALCDPGDILSCGDQRRVAYWQWRDQKDLRDPHFILDVFGLVPGVGEPADLLNAGIYTLEGDWTNAGLSTAATVPVFGWGATGAKLGLKGATGGARAYSVAYETVIPKVGAGTRGAHYKAANEAFLAEMADPQFAAAIKDLGIVVPTSKTGTALGRSPTDWTWHHSVDRPGVMRLVPFFQHKQGSSWQHILHPGRIGGYKRWGAEF